MSITKVGFMRRTIMNHGFINRIGSLIRKDTCRKTRYDFLDLIKSKTNALKTYCSRETYTRLTLYSFDCHKTLSLISMFSRKKSSLYFMFLNKPPTIAAKWTTWVGLYFSKIALTSCSFLQIRRFNQLGNPSTWFSTEIFFFFTSSHHPLRTRKSTFRFPSCRNVR
jgi:hypothetical protein